MVGKKPFDRNCQHASSFRWSITAGWLKSFPAIGEVNLQHSSESMGCCCGSAVNCTHHCNVDVLRSYGLLIYFFLAHV
jgi:hypothetical protein